MAYANRSVATNGIRMAIRDEGTGPAVVLCHGFPELAYSWRRQVPALATAGYRAIAPDQRGYGGTDRPAGVTDYDIHHLTADLVGLLDALGIERAVFVGHDWGGVVVWMMPLLHRARVAGVIGVNTPYFPRPSGPPIEIMRTMYGDNYYIVHFQQPGVADEALARDVRRVFTQLVRSGVPQDEFRAAVANAAGGGMRNMVEMIAHGAYSGRPLLSDAELDVYVEAFERTGFTGGLNWYRNLDRNWETTAQLDGAVVDVPSLMITAEYDPVLRPELAEAMRPLVPDLEVAAIARCGHWTPHERPEELNRLVLDWLQRRYR
jgi:pimeloyl-ACP methyl ester carboxylesterase